MLSEDSKKSIDSLSKEELRLEINNGSRSRFQGEKFSYVQTRLQELEEKEASSQKDTEFGLATEANELSREANRIAEGAHKTSRNAWRASVLAVIVSLLAIVVPMCSPRQEVSAAPNSSM